MFTKKKREIVDHRRTVPERIFFAIFFTVLAIWAFLMLSMFFWAVASALKTNLDYVREPLKLPSLANLQWKNFKVATERLNHNGVGFYGMLWNSTWLVCGSTFLSVFMHVMVGYFLAQYDFKGKNLILAIVIFITIIPIYGSLPAMYKLIYDLHLNDSYWYLLTALGGYSSTVLITYGYFKGIPRTYREAVYVDGGSDITAFIKIGLPMSKSIFIALFLLSFIHGWNNYETSILYFDSMPSLASGLYYFQQEIIYEANNPAYFAGAIMAMLPILLLFIFFSDKIMGKMYSGGIKG